MKTIKTNSISSYIRTNDGYEQSEDIIAWRCGQKDELPVLLRGLFIYKDTSTVVGLGLFSLEHWVEDSGSKSVQPFLCCSSLDQIGHSSARDLKKRSEKKRKRREK
jgi:hypothetical protein